VSSAVGIAATLLALGAFAAIGVRAASHFGVAGRDRYLSARGSQGAATLALSLFASALGAWILFAPPEVGTFGGILGIAGYAVGQGAAIAVFAFLGPAVRRRAAGATTLLEFVRARHGAPLHAYVAAVSILYMLVFLAAELTAVGGAVALLSGADRLVPIVAVAAVTAAYTAYGGLPASLATDRWQGLLVLGLVALTAVALVVDVDAPLAAVREAQEAADLGTGAELFAVLVIAIVAANLFHQGFWQRVWAARDERALRRASLAGAALILPVVLVLGLTGMAASGGEPLEAPSLALFTLLEGFAAPLLVLVAVLAVALVASSVDTLQNGIAALLATGLSSRRLRLPGARVATVLLTLPAAAVALADVSVLRLFLVADLLAATVAAPVVLGLWRAASPRAALAGAVAGVLAVVAVGSLDGGVVAGVRLLTLPHGASLDAFVAAPVASAAVTVAGSLPGRRPRLG
jgi:solute:Na+ symporter, SSS family